MKKFLKKIHSIIAWIIIAVMCLTTLAGILFLMLLFPAKGINRVDFYPSKEPYDLLVQACFKDDRETIKELLTKNIDLTERFFTRYGLLFRIYLKTNFIPGEDWWSASAGDALIQGIVYRITNQPSREEYLKQLYGTHRYLSDLVPADKKGDVVKRWLDSLGQLNIPVRGQIEGKSFLGEISSFGPSAYPEFIKSRYFKEAKGASWLPPANELRREFEIRYEMKEK